MKKNQRKNNNASAKKRKILYVSGTRADYGLMRSTLLGIKKSKKLDLEIAVTGMHLMKESGRTIDEIKKDGHKFTIIDAVYDKDDKESMARFIGKCIWKLVGKIQKIKPDVILILGDRGEMLAAAIVGTYLTIPVAHLHGGEITSTVDETARHAITKLSHLHLAATQKSKEKILWLGEEEWRIKVVGAPGLDAIINKKLPSITEIGSKFNLDLKEPFLIVLQHPVTENVNDASKQIKTTLAAVTELKKQTIVIYPNADAGGRQMIKTIEQFRRFPFIRILKNIEHDFYLGLMKHAGVLIGNSSSGIIEAPSFGLPVVNIGDRQIGRERAKNVINVGYKKEKIIAAVKKALYNQRFRSQDRFCENPYGDGKTGQKIINILSRVEINPKLLFKKLIY